MNESLIKLIEYRISKAEESLADAEILIELSRWTSAVNRLYYAVYYIVSALLIKDNIHTKTHAGLRNQFNLIYIKTGIFPKSYGILFSDLFDCRQKGDYGDLFDFDKNSVEPFLIPVKQFIENIKKNIKA